MNRRLRASSDSSSFAGRAVTGHDAEPLITADHTRAGYPTTSENGKRGYVDHPQRHKSLRPRREVLSCR
jgi:hypothetical protein